LDCGATRVDSQIGLEQTPEAFVAELVAVFREVKRVLRDDGTLWLNLGDSYAATTKGSSGKGEKQITNAGTLLADRSWRVPDGLKPKDLIGIPWRVAFALQADGWYLRQDIIWHKPNPMPESVKDRCTKAHEYIFLLSKSERYFYDADAIKEENADPDRKTYIPGKRAFTAESMEQQPATDTRERRNYGFEKYKNGAVPDGRNRRSVWTVATKPFAGAHFATFPPDLIEPCVKAGSKPGDLVLDPFGGAGTTGLVADRLGRNAVLCELNPTYAELARERLTSENPMFTEVLVK